MAASFSAIEFAQGRDQRFESHQVNIILHIFSSFFTQFGKKGDLNTKLRLLGCFDVEALN
jgi:hypothetical protein